MLRDFDGNIVADVTVVFVVVTGTAVVVVVVEIGLCVVGDFIEFSDDECFIELLSVEPIVSIKAGEADVGSLSVAFDVV